MDEIQAGEFTAGDRSPVSGLGEARRAVRAERAVGLAVAAANVFAGAVGMLDVDGDRGVGRRRVQVEDLHFVVVVDFLAVGGVEEVELHRPFLVVVDIVVADV